MYRSMRSENRIIFISWQPYCSRSDNLAREFNGKSYMVYYGYFGSEKTTIIPKYILQFFKTIVILLREKPDIVFVMSPPVFACIPVFLYCLYLNKIYIIDAHTGAFKNPIWSKVLFLQKFLCQKAKVTIVTNKHLYKIVENWGAKGMIVPDVPIKYPNIEKLIDTDRTVITLINSFATDEPIEEFLMATRHFEKVDFYITGRFKKENLYLKKMVNGNVYFTDFLPYSKFYGLVFQSHIIITLTTKDNTMQRGGYEAIYFEKPIVTSNWDILKENFEDAAVYVENNEISIVRGIKRATKNRIIYSEKASKLKKKKLEHWKSNKKTLSNIMFD